MAYIKLNEFRNEVEKLKINMTTDVFGIKLNGPYFDLFFSTATVSLVDVLKFVQKIQFE